MARSSGIEALKGTWDHVSDDNMDAFLKEIGVPMPARLMAKGLKPRVIISENDGTWTLRAETSLRTKSVTFTPDVEYEEKTADGRDIKTIVHFNNGAWEHTMRDKHGKESTATRFVNDQGQQQLDMICGSVTARRLFKRA